MSTTQKEDAKKSSENQKKFTWYFMGYKSEENLVKRKILTPTKWKAFEKTIFKTIKDDSDNPDLRHSTCFSLNVVRGVDTDNLVFYFEESNETSRFNKNAVWIAKFLPKSFTPTGNVLIARKNFRSNVNGDDVDVGLSLKEIRKLLKSYHERKSINDFDQETTITELREMKTEEFMGYLNMQRTYHNYITCPFWLHRNGHYGRTAWFLVSNRIMQKEFPGVKEDVPYTLARIIYRKIYASLLLEGMAQAAGRILLHPYPHACPDFQMDMGLTYPSIKASDVYVEVFRPKDFKVFFGPGLQLMHLGSRPQIVDSSLVLSIPVSSRPAQVH